jgi:hypothetical protein
MKIKINNREIFELSETQKKVIKNDIHDDEFDADMERRLKYILSHKYEQCFKRLKAEWEPKLKTKLESIPTNDDAFAELVFSQPDYKSRKTRDAETNL